MQNKQPNVTFGTDPDGKLVIWLHPPATLRDIPPEAFLRIPPEERKNAEARLAEGSAIEVRVGNPIGQPRPVRSSLSETEKEILASGYLTLLAIIVFLLTLAYLWSLT